MAHQPPIDVEALAMRRARAMAQPVAGSDFLMRHVADDLVLRLSTVMRSFDDAVVLNAADRQIGEVLRSTGKVGRLLESAQDIAFANEQIDLIATHDALPFAHESLNLMVSPLTMQFV
ncbi:MAG: SAM-dependent methyltransferase, partial [Pseudomonadota bacterium]